MTGTWIPRAYGSDIDGFATHKWMYSRDIFIVLFSRVYILYIAVENRNVRVLVRAAESCSRVASSFSSSYSSSCIVPRFMFLRFA